MSENDTSCEETPVDLPEDDNDFHKGEEEEENQKKTRSNESAVWEFFTKVPPFSSKQAKCDICRETKSYKSCTTNLKNHLKNRHEKSYNKYLNVVKMKRARNAEGVMEADFEDSVVARNAEGVMEADFRDSVVCERSVSGKGTVRDRSIWRYFASVTGERKRAKCKFCDKKLSYRSTIANLKTHLAVKHYDLIDDDVIGKSLSNYKSYKNRMIKPAEKYPKTTKKAKLWQFVDFEQDNAYGDEINHDTNAESSERKFFEEETDEIVKHRKNLSYIWSYFERVDRVNQLARCNTCEQVFNCTSVTNLKMHLERMHSKGAVQRTSKNDRQTETSSALKKRKKTSAVWSKFTVYSEEDKIAKCNVCEQKCSYKSSVSNLSKHLKKMHGLHVNGPGTAINKLGLSGGDKSRNYPQRVNKRRTLRSGVWKHFDLSDMSNKRVARCRRCDARLSGVSSTNLRAHLRRHLVSGHEEVVDEQSPVWAYFNCLSRDQKLASCLICKKRVDYGDDDDLKRHLGRKHPQAYNELENNSNKPRKLMITGNGDIYEIDENITKSEPPAAEEADDDETHQWPDNDDEVDALETEFLDESCFIDAKSEPKKMRLQQNTPKLLHKEWRPTSGKGSVQFSSEIWRHFDVEEDEAICGLCRETVPVGLKDMKNHLGEKHSEVLDDLTHKVLDAASEEDNELGDDMYTEVVYIENEDKNMSNTEKHSKTVKQKKAKVKIERNSSTSSDDILVKSRHKRFSKEPDELESFFNYIKVLLKKVPKEASQKLHLDIIKLIMNATQPENNVINNVSLETGYLNSANTNMLLDKNIVLTQNNTTASDVNCLNTQKIMLVPVQNITTRNIEKNTSQVVTIPNTSINISSGINTSNGISKSVPDTRFDKQIR